LGCINHALLSAQAINSDGLKLAGWVANCIDPEMPELEANIATLKQRLNAPLLGVVPNVADVSGAKAQARACGSYLDLAPLLD
jgi:dethiobiotin synthetase